MAESDPPIPPRAGLPDPRTVVGEAVLQPRPRTVFTAAGATATASPTVDRVLRTNQMDPYDEAVGEGEIHAFGAAAPTGDEFRGPARRAAKIAIAAAATERFEDFADLIDGLPAHEAMVEREPKIGDGAESGRVEEERRNVGVRAFLYAASREDDNDYHLIVGRDPNRTPVSMTMELSGWPPASSPAFERLRSARTAYRGFFGDDLPGTSYDFYDPPIELEVEGSLFFDISHATGSRPGPQDLRPDMPVVWEVHPITEIVLEP